MKNKIHECISCYENNDFKLLVNNLKDIICDVPKELSKVCSWHPFGFLKINLGSVLYNEKKTNAQVNIWLPNIRSEQDTPSVCHVHNSDLYSVILTGNLVNTNYYIKDDLDSGLYSIYKVIYEEQRSISKLYRQGIDCLVDNISLLGKEEKYMIKLNTFHSTFIPIGLFTCTFVIRTNFDNNSETFNVRFNKEIDEYIFNRNLAVNKEAALYAINQFLAL